MIVRELLIVISGMLIVSFFIGFCIQSWRVFAYSFVILFGLGVGLLYHADPCDRQPDELSCLARQDAAQIKIRAAAENQFLDQLKGSPR